MIVFDLVRAEKVNTTLRLSVVRHTTDPTHDSSGRSRRLT